MNLSTILNNSTLTKLISEDMLDYNLRDLRWNIIDIRIYNKVWGGVSDHADELVSII